MRVLASCPSEIETGYNPRAYLYQVSRRLSINHHRRERLVRFTGLEEDEAIGIVDPAPSAERIVYSRQCLARTRIALAALPERTQTAFMMHRLGGYTIAEVAKELGLSTTRTWGLIHEAYRHLIAQVDDL